jgi:hypothetical protein
METNRMNGDKLSLDHHIEIPEGWSEQLFEKLITFVKGRYTPCISTVQALVIAQNHRASLDEKIASSWLMNSAVSLIHKLRRRPITKLNFFSW